MKKSAVWLSFLLILTACGETTRLTIVDFNDTHAKYEAVEENDELLGGAARWATFVDEMREENENILVLHAGDMLTGTVFCSIYKGQMGAEIMNQVGFDAMVAGNHEWDYGYANALAFDETLDAPLLSANAFDPETLSPVFLPYWVTNISGVDAVMIGISTANYGVYGTDMDENVLLQDEISTLSNLLFTENLAEEYPLVILLSHCGYEKDKEIAKAFPEIDVIVGGHSHTKLDGGDEVNGVVIVQAGQYGMYGGELALKLRGGKVVDYEYTLHDLDGTYAEDPEVAAYISEMDEAIGDEMGKKVYTSEYELVQTGLRENPLPIGNFFCDLMNSYARADVMILNAGSLRASLPTGEVTLEDIYELFPYDNNLYVATIDGKTLKSIVQKGIDGRGEGAFLYYSKGFLADASGDELVVSLNGEEVSDDALYTVGLSDYMYEGGDNYTEFASSTDLLDTGFRMRDLIVSYFENLGTLTENDVDTAARVILD